MAPMEPCPTYEHRLASLWTAISWCWKAQGLTEQGAVLDVSAGAGLLGVFGQSLVAQNEVPPFHYGATEQSLDICRMLEDRMPHGAIAKWRHDPQVGHALRQALGESTGQFLPEYPVVVLSHVLEHVEDPYGVADQAWDMVRPGGFLVLCVPRMDYHRTHASEWNWERLLAMARDLAAFGNPVITWEFGAWADLLVAVPKAAAPAAIKVAAHSDHRLNQLVPITSFTEAGKYAPGSAR